MLPLGLFSFSAILDIDGRSLRDPASTLSTLVMFASPSCEQCHALRPHLEEMQKKLNADGASVVMAALDATRHPDPADELNVRSFPAFGFYPSHAKAAPTLFSGQPSLRPLVAWTMAQLVKTTQYRPHHLDPTHDQAAGH